MTQGELEARILAGERALASAPPDVSRELRLTAQAEADTWQQAAAAATRHDPGQSHNAQVLANHMAAERARFETATARYEGWSAKTASSRETAGRAKAELHRRGIQPATAGPEQQSTLEWWREFEADVEAAGHALARQHQAAIDAGQPWQPIRLPKPSRKPSTHPIPRIAYQNKRKLPPLSASTRLSARHG